ncbi:Elongator subunit elp2 [Malassezia sp. CBS 17886]|nr:Elongator subunit elp2 [Malassezia sp. CBS 17886]
MAPGTVSYEYLACAVNTTAHAADWVHLCTPESAGVDVCVFAVHRGFTVWTPTRTGAPQRGPVHHYATQFPGPVHVLKALQPYGHRAGLLVGSDAGALELWEVCARGDDITCERCGSLAPAHSAPVTAVGVARGDARPAGAPLVFASGSSDGTVTIWHAHGAHAEAAESLSLHGQYPLDIALAYLPGETARPVLLMAVGVTGRHIQLYAREGDGAFALLHTLAGHEDWVRALDWASTRRADGTCALHLASASQDGNVRLWTVHAETDAAPCAPADEFEAAAQTLLSADRNIATKRTRLPFSSTPARWVVALDALLVGHDGWVTGVRWHPSCGAQRAALLTSSADNSMIVWAPETSAASWPLLADARTAQALWIPAQRLGDVGSLSGGFLGALWVRADASAVLTYDRHGAAHVWAHDARWTPLWAPGGHAGAARSVAWEPCGDYCLSTGADRTTRVHGTCVAADGGRTWHEIARPQSHGYALQEAVWMSRSTFVSAADEKVLRVFGAPRAFVDRVRALHTLQTRTQPVNVLALDARSPAAFRAGAQMSRIVQAAMRSPRHAGLAVLVYSDLLAPLASRDAPGPESVALNDVEVLLKHIYTAGWAVAVEQDQLLADIDVFLIPAASDAPRAAAITGDWVLRRRALVEHIYVLDDPLFSVDAAALRPFAPRAHETISGDFHANEAPSAPFPRQRVVAVGGTFDHLHIGHKLLLSAAALCATERLIVGVTDTALLSKKKHPEYVESLACRCAAVRQFLSAFCATMRPVELDIQPIADVAGPAGTDAELELLVVTDETAAGADAVAKVRAENGVQPVDVYAVSLVDDTAGAGEAAAATKVGSTAIRSRLAAVNVAPGTEYSGDTELAEAAALRPLATLVPPLGLSNRASEAGAGASDAESGATTHSPEHALQSEDATRPTPNSSRAPPPSEPHPSARSLPVPEELQSLTLWPELEKLYGHGYELLSVDADPPSGLVASTCRATTREHAVVRLFDSHDRWRPVHSALDAHALSVTRVRFSADGSHVLTVSRDRSWHVYRRADGGEFVPVAGERAHARIIWDGAWAIEPGIPIFATASRDKTVKVWRLHADGGAERPYVRVALLHLDDAVTAVALGPSLTLAVGLERGDVLVFRADPTASAWTLHFALSHHHTAAVTGLAFRPPGGWMNACSAAAPYNLLSSGEDGCVRVISWAQA